MSLNKLLMEMFGLTEDMAQKIASNESLEDFEKKFNRLESIVGFDVAIDVIKHGQFPKYRNSHLENYFSLARDLQQKLGGKYGQFGNEEVNKNKHSFYSIESLENFLGKDNKKEVKEINDVSAVIHKNRLLHKDNDASIKYLGSLIDNGYVEVGEHEHWSRGTTTNARGRNILKQIRRQLTDIFNEFDVCQPKYDLHFAEHRLYIDDGSRETLKIIREKTYRMQK